MATKSRWRATGYPAIRMFPGQGACAFRLSHVRDDGLAVVTLGDYRPRNRLEYIQGHSYCFVTWVALEEPEEVEDATGEIVRKAKRYEFERAGANNWSSATALHYSLLEHWEHREADKAEAKMPEAA